MEEGTVLRVTLIPRRL